MSNKLKKRIKRTTVGAMVFAAGMLYILLSHDVDNNTELILFLGAYLIMGEDIIRTAAKNIGHGQLFDENFLMSVATIGAFFVGSYPEAAAVMLFYQIGECFQSYAVNKSRKSISDLMDIRPDHANVIRDGIPVQVSPEEVKIGEIIQVKPGEKVPLDAVITKGSTSLNTMALTGESIPLDIQEGGQIISGCVNLTGVIEAQVQREFGESTVSKILNLMETSSSKKANVENFITRFSRYYTPIVVFAALFLAVIPSILTGKPDVWIYRALSFLVISCPCAFVVSVPLTFFGGIGAAGREGILVKGGNYLEALAHAEIVVMDKTGTLTQGVFSVTKIKLASQDLSSDMTSEKLLELAAYAESQSSHPISLSILKAFHQEIDSSRISDIHELAGFGVSALLDGKEVLAGNDKLIREKQIADHGMLERCGKEESGTVVHIAIDGNYCGYLVISDTVRADSAAAVKELYQQQSVKKIVMLTGDGKAVAEHIAAELGIKDFYAGLLPEDKVNQVERLLQEKTKKGKLLFVGDGINDAPVLARADVGIAMGGIGSDAAIEAADVVIMDDQPSKISRAIDIAKKTVMIAGENTAFAIAVKLVVLCLAAVGIATMWAAIFADVGVTFLAVLNAMRALHLQKKKIPV